MLHATDDRTPAGAPAAPAAGPWVFQRGGGTRAGVVAPGLPQAVLFDRDGTLVEDVPYNGDPGRVRPMPWALDALAALRARGVPVGVVSNQSGVARGLLTRAQVEAVQRRVEQFLGPFDVWVVCPHGPGDGCACRKPAPGLVLTAAARLGADPRRTVVIGDIGADLGAARAAGARGVLVPTPVTRPEEVAAAERTAPTLLAAVRALLADAEAPETAEAPVAAVTAVTADDAAVADGAKGADAEGAGR